MRAILFSIAIAVTTIGPSSARAIGNLDARPEAFITGCALLAVAFVLRRSLGDLRA